MSDGVFDSTIGALNTSLNLRMMNQNVISSNIANADTPGYKAKDLEFEGALREVLGVSQGLRPETDHPEQMAKHPTDPVNPEVIEQMDGVESLDGNTVDRSKEMAKLAENQLLYDASTELMKRKLGMLKYSVSEGGGNR